MAPVARHDLGRRRLGSLHSSVERLELNQAPTRERLASAAHAGSRRAGLWPAWRFSTPVAGRRARPQGGHSRHSRYPLPPGSPAAPAMATSLAPMSTWWSCMSARRGKPCLRLTRPELVSGAENGRRLGAFQGGGAAMGRPTRGAGSLSGSPRSEGCGVGMAAGGAAGQEARPEEGRQPTSAPSWPRRG